MTTTTNEKKTLIFTMRLPVGLHNVISELAKKDKRSMAKEIEYLTEYAIERLSNDKTR